MGSNIGHLNMQDFARLALFQATGNPLFAAEQALDAPPARRRGIMIDIDGVPLEVVGTHHAGLAESKLSPAEPEDFEIDAVYIGSIDVTRLLVERAPKILEHIRERLS